MLATTTPHLANALSVLRISLHVLAATIWIGGQFVVAGLLPTVRTFGEDAPRKIAKAFGRLSWPAYALLIITGIWNVTSLDTAHASSTWNMVFGIKMAFVLLAGLGAFLHTRAKTAQARGIFAGIGLLSSIVAMALGVAVAG